MKKKEGSLLIGVMLVFIFLMIIVPVIIRWVQNDTKFSVKDQKLGIAFNLAEAAVDRGYWKIKSSTGTCARVSLGTSLPGYNFDAAYGDIPGGTYRIKISSGPDIDQITIYGEGRDTLNHETRAIKAVYHNSSIPGSVLSSGPVKVSGSSIVHWGPVMSKGNITVSGAAAIIGYPRKLAMQTVVPLDPTGDTNPPNTDSLEWWSNYNVPDLPIFDFDTMKASAAATGTLNCQDGTNACVGSDCDDSGGHCDCVEKTCSGSGCNDSGSHCDCTGSGASRVCTGRGCNDSGANCDCVAKTCTGTGCYDSGGNCSCALPMQCCSSTVYGGTVTCAYGGDGCTNCTVTSLFHQTAMRDKDYTWYWDHNATFMGYNGIKGTVVVRGNMSVPNDKDDRYCRSDDTTQSVPAVPGCTVPVPPTAWMEYQKYDTSASNEYPGDTGLHQNAASYRLGSNESSASSGGLYKSGELWRMPTGTLGLGADLGFYGFVYVGGDFTRDGPADIYGAIWVEGATTGQGNTMIFYNAKLKVPTLNVVLVRESWQEQMPSTQPWP